MKPDNFTVKDSLNLNCNTEDSHNCDILSDSQILNIIMNNSQDTIYFKDKNSRFIANSKAHAVQFGVNDPKELRGKSDFDFFPKEFAEEAIEDEKRIMETGIPVLGKVEKWDILDDEDIWFSASKYPLYNEEGKVIGTWGTSRDISPLKLAQDEMVRLNEELEKANERLKRISNIDGLSGLYNQRCFYETLEDAIEVYKDKQNNNQPGVFCIMLIDIDRFKSVNDMYGHTTGDKTIQFVADLIQKNTRISDLCFRCGGDEFGVILYDTDNEQGLRMADRLRKIIEKSSFNFNNKTIQLTVSIGVASYDMNQSLNSILIKVDSKLYASKKQGKNQVN